MINPIGNKGSDDVVRPGGTDEAATTQKSASVRGIKKNAALEPAKGDKVELSSFARDMQAIRQRLGDQAAERAAQVEALRQSVEQGTYQMDTRAVAQKMYDSGMKG